MSSWRRNMESLINHCSGDQNFHRELRDTVCFDSLLTDHCSAVGFPFTHIFVTFTFGLTNPFMNIWNKLSPLCYTVAISISNTPMRRGGRKSWKMTHKVFRKNADRLNSSTTWSFRSVDESERRFSLSHHLAINLLVRLFPRVVERNTFRLHI